nr:hypothetical protein CFP56_02663 [Quercus suber]
MTPAVLPGHRAHAHPQTGEPCVVVSSDSKDTVHGMLVFGLGRRSRSRIKSHYRRLMPSSQVAVFVDIIDELPGQKHGRSCFQFELRRKCFAANVFLWQNARMAGVNAHLQRQEWTLESYIANSLTKEGPETMTVGPQGGPYATVTGSDTGDWAGGQNHNQREVVNAPPGHIDYEIADGFAGWGLSPYFNLKTTIVIMVIVLHTYSGKCGPLSIRERNAESGLDARSKDFMILVYAKLIADTSGSQSNVQDHEAYCLASYRRGRKYHARMCVDDVRSKPVRMKHVPSISSSAIRHRPVAERSHQRPGKHWAKALWRTVIQNSKQEEWGRSIGIAMRSIYMRRSRNDSEERANQKLQVLICDGFDTHETLEALEFCFANSIVSCRLRSHTPHKLQPRDIAGFAPAPAAYRDNIVHLERGSVNTIGKQHFRTDVVVEHGGSYEAHSANTSTTPITPATAEPFMSSQNLIVNYDTHMLDDGNKQSLERDLYKLAKANQTFIAKSLIQGAQTQFVLEVKQRS